VGYAWHDLNDARRLGLLNRLGIGFDPNTSPSGGSGEGGSGNVGGSGGDTGPPSGAPAGGSSGGSPPSAAGDPPSPAFTQADIDRERKAAEKAGKTAAAQELAAQLGVPLEDAKRFIAERQAAEDAKKDEATKAREEADKAKAEADQAKAEAAAVTRKAHATLALARTGVPQDRLEDAMTLLLANLAAEADEDAITAAAEKLKTDKPWLFGTAAPGGTDFVPAGAPGGGQGGPAKGIDAGRERGRKVRESRQGSGDALDGFRVIGRSA
jgi:hypothetical protein